MLIEKYNEHLSQATSINGLNQINIAYGNTLTPQELVELDEGLFGPGYQIPALREDRQFSDEELKSTVRSWVESEMAHLQLMGKAEAEPFLRRDLRRSMTLYTDGASRADKTLIVGIPGANNRLMMPVAALLQALDARTVDIVLIRDPTRTVFFNGLEGFAETRDGLIDALPGYLDFGAYRQVVSLGVSAGGLPALLIGLRLGLAATLVCGGDTPNDPRQAEIGGPAAAAALTEAGKRGFATRVTIAFGAQHDADREAARELGEFIGVEPLEVTNDEGDVRHNILFPLAKEGRLPSFLRDRLGL